VARAAAKNILPVFYLEDFLPLELDDARRGIGDNDFGGAAEDRFLWFDKDEAEAAALDEAAVAEDGPSSTLENVQSLGQVSPS